MPKTSPRGSKSKLSLKPFIVAAVGASAAVVGLARSEPAPQARSPQAQAAEQETRDLVEQRTALHLQKLRAQ